MGKRWGGLSSNRMSTQQGREPLPTQSKLVVSGVSPSFPGGPTVRGRHGSGSGTKARRDEGPRSTRTGGSDPWRPTQEGFLTSSRVQTEVRRRDDEAGPGGPGTFSVGSTSSTR